MKIGIPVSEDRGLDSPVSGHFGSASYFAFVDTESGECRVVANANQHHGHGACHPLAALAGEKPDGLVVGGIGARALMGLTAAGLRVFLTREPSVAKVLGALRGGELQEASLETTCGHHGAQGHGATPHGGARSGCGHGGH